VLFDDFGGDGEAEAGALALGGEEGFEDAVEVGGADAGAAIDDGEGETAAGGLDADDDLGAGGRGLDGVEDEIEEDLFELFGVGDDFAGGGGDLFAEGDGGGAGGVAGEREDRVDDGLRIDGLEARRAGAGELEEAREEAVEALGFEVDDLEAGLEVLVRGVAAAEDAGGAGDAGERVTDLVGEAGRELAGGGEALGLAQLFDVLAQLLVDLFELALGHFEARSLAALLF